MTLTHNFVIEQLSKCQKYSFYDSFSRLSSHFLPQCISRHLKWLNYKTLCESGLNRRNICRTLKWLQCKRADSAIFSIVLSTLIGLRTGSTTFCNQFFPGTLALFTNLTQFKTRINNALVLMQTSRKTLCSISPEKLSYRQTNKRVLREITLKL